MKKLKIALTVLLALTCTLFLFACKPKTDNGTRQIIEVEIRGAKTSFTETEEFTMGENAQVIVIYSDSDDEVVLAKEDYDVDSSSYDSQNAGEYTIIVTPKNQSTDHEPVTGTYKVNVEHNFEDQGEGKQVCKGCGATRESHSGLTTKITTVAWGQPAQLDQGTNGYPNLKAPATGENHVALDNLIMGQSVTFTLTINEIDTSAVWFTPLMGIRSGSKGFISREDGWVIATAAGFVNPWGAATGFGANGGAATTTSPEWEVFGEGTTWTAADIDGQQLSIAFDYQMNGVFIIRHTILTGAKANTTYTYTVRVPDSSYELVGYGEKVTYTITDSAFTAGRVVTGFTATAPTNLKQAEGKLFDTTGSTTTATFSKGDPVNGVGLYFADAADGTKVNLSNEPLQAGMTNFRVEFGGMEAKLSGISVVETYVSGAKSVVVEAENERFESAGATYDYDLTADKNGIRLVGTGAPSKLTAAQKEALGTSEDYFLAFRINCTREFIDINVTKEDVYTSVNGSNIDVIVPVGAKAENFSIEFTGEEDAVLSTLLVDLAGIVSDRPSVSVEITDIDYTLDEGGTYEVTYYGATESASLFLVGAQHSVADVKAGIEAHDEFYAFGNTVPQPGMASITKVDTSDSSKLVVTYKFPAINVFTVSQASDFIGSEIGVVVDGEKLTIKPFYQRTLSEAAVELDNDTYVLVSGDKLAVISFVESHDIKDGAAITATLNLENENAVSYNVGLTVNKGVAEVVDANVITTNATTTNRFFVLGGNVNDSTDFDEAAVFIVLIDLKTVGIRTEAADELFHFTANENPAGQTDYTVYTVTGDAITSEKVTPSGERVGLRAASCLEDGISAFKYKDTSFYFGAIVSPASGAHVFGAYEDGVAVCENCGAINYRVEIGEGYRYSVIAAPAGKDVINPDTDSGDWWANPTADVALSGDFVVHYTWENTDANYPGGGAIEIHADSDYFGFRTFEADLNPVTSPLVGGTITTEFKVNGAVVEDILGEGNDKKPEGDNGWKGEADIVVYRVGTTLTIIQKLTTTDGTVFDVVTTVTDFSDKDVAIHINGNHYFCANIKMSVGTVAIEYLKDDSALDLEINAIKGAVKNGISISAKINGFDRINTDTDGDWGTFVVQTKSDIRVTLPNLDPYFNTTEGDNAFPKLGGLFPSADVDLVNGGVWDSFLRKEIYLTLSISVEEGVKFYGNGVLLVWYKADRAWDTKTVRDFCAYVLGEIEADGFTAFAQHSEGASATNLYITSAMNDTQAEQQYRSVYPNAD